MPRQKCECITRSGKRCSKYAVHNGKFCSIHVKKCKETVVQKKSRRVQNLKLQKTREFVVLPGRGYFRKFIAYRDDTHTPGIVYVYEELGTSDGLTAKIYPYDLSKPSEVYAPLYTAYVHKIHGVLISPIELTDRVQSEDVVNFYLGILSTFMKNVKGLDTRYKKLGNVLQTTTSTPRRVKKF